MSDYIMKVIPEKGTATAIEITKKIPAIKGGGEDNYLCGKCSFTICKNIRQGLIINMVFKCPNCGSYNTI